MINKFCNNIGRIHHITGIPEQEIFSACLCYTFIHSMINPTIWLTYPVGYFICIFVNHINATIIRAPINDNPFYFLIPCLAYNTFGSSP